MEGLIYDEDKLYASDKINEPHVQWFTSCISGVETNGVIVGETRECSVGERRLMSLSYMT